MAKVIERSGRPALVLAHNNFLAAQLYHESRHFFPHTLSNISSATTITISPEPTFLPAISISRKKRPSTRNSTSCGSPHAVAIRAARLRHRRQRELHLWLGSPDAYYGMLIMLERARKSPRTDLVSVWWKFSTNGTITTSAVETFRIRGDVIEVFPTYDDYAYRIELWGDEIESLSQIDPLLGQVRQTTFVCPSIPRPTTC